MTARTGSPNLNDDAAAALRRACAFAGLFGLAGIAAAACTMRVDDARANPASDALRAEEAQLVAQIEGAPSVAFPAALLARRADPAVARTIDAADRRFAAHRAAAALRRERIAGQIGAARADRDLLESRRSLLRMKLEQGRNGAASSESAGAIRAEIAATAARVTDTGARINRLTDLIAAESHRSRSIAASRLATVRGQLKGV